MQGADLGRTEGASALSGVFKKDIFTFRGLLKNGIPDGETYMEIGKADSISVSTFWKDGKLIEGKGVLDGVPVTLTGSEESNAVQVDLETGERCAFIWSDPMAILTDIKAKLDEQRAIREKLAAEMMAASQPAEPVQTPAPEPAAAPAVEPATAPAPAE